MDKTSLIQKVVEDTQISKKDVSNVVNAAIETIAEAITSGDKVVLSGFGTFTSSNRKARTSRNVRTGEPVEVPAKVVPKFVPGKKLKESGIFNS